MTRIIQALAVPLVGLVFMISGCSQQPATQAQSPSSQNPSSSNRTSNDASNNAVANALYNPEPTVNFQSDVNSHSDGNVISITPLYQSYQKSEMYDMYYYSQGEKVEAYVELPKVKGTYPIFVGLHGGAPITYEQDEHVGGPYAATSDQISFHTGKAIYLYPEYQGYLNSDGYVHGIQSNATDVMNGLKAVESLEGYGTGGVYFFGISMGGGVALYAASELSDVKAVVVNSPFVGLDLFDQWYEKLGKPDNPYWQEWYNHSIELYGVNYSSSSYSQRSIVDRISTIDAPVLFLQGTSDQRVIWQTVQELDSDMKQQQKTVKLVLYKGGQHGLSTDPSIWGESTDATQAWLSKYGFPETYLSGTVY